MATEIRVPTLGESVSEATIAQWFKKPGDPIAIDEPLVELETDKVTVEVPAPAAGTLAEIVANEGDTVGVDALLANITANGAAAAPAAASAPAAAPAESAASVDVMVPTLGESVTEATVSVWFKKVGDSVAQDEMLCELETDKVSVEVPAPAAGVLSEITAPEGSTVEASAKLGVIAGSGAAVAAAPTAAPAAAAAPATAGKDIANPGGLVLSAAMLLGWLGDRHGNAAFHQAQQAIEQAVSEQITSVEGRTGDLGGTAGTASVGRQLTERLAC